MSRRIYSPFSHEHKFNTQAKYGDPPYITYTIIIIIKRVPPPRANVQLKLPQRENGRVLMKGNSVALTLRPPRIHTRARTHTDEHLTTFYTCVCMRVGACVGTRIMDLDR